MGALQKGLFQAADYYTIKPTVCQGFFYIFIFSLTAKNWRGQGPRSVAWIAGRWPNRPQKGAVAIIALQRAKKRLFFTERY